MFDEEKVKSIPIEFEAMKLLLTKYQLKRYYDTGRIDYSDIEWLYAEETDLEHVPEWVFEKEIQLVHSEERNQKKINFRIKKLGITLDVISNSEVWTRCCFEQTTENGRKILYNNETDYTLQVMVKDGGQWLFDNKEITKIMNNVPKVLIGEGEWEDTYKKGIKTLVYVRPHVLFKYLKDRNGKIQFKKL